MNPLDLKVGDLIVCETMKGFVGKVNRIVSLPSEEGERLFEIVALTDYFNHNGTERFKGSSYTKSSKAEGWGYYKPKPKKYLVFLNKNLKED